MISSCEEEDKRAVPLTIEALVTDVSSFNGSDGSIELKLTGGEKPFWFFWSTGDTTKNISNLFAGTYTVKIIYGKNGSYIVQKSYTISQPDANPLNLSFTISTLRITGIRKEK